MQYREVCKFVYNCDPWPCIECVDYCIALYVLICQIPTFNLVAASHTVL